MTTFVGHHAVALEPLKTRSRIKRLSFLGNPEGKPCTSAEQSKLSSPSTDPAKRKYQDQFEEPGPGLQAQISFHSKSKTRGHLLRPDIHNNSIFIGKVCQKVDEDNFSILLSNSTWLSAIGSIVTSVSLLGI